MRCARRSGSPRWRAIRALPTSRCANKTRPNWTASSRNGPRRAIAGKSRIALQRAGVAAFPTLSNKDLAHDPHLRERGYLVELEHPEVGKRIDAGIPWTMSATPCQIWRAAPLLGQDTDYVLRSLLGYLVEKIR